MRTVARWLLIAVLAADGIIAGVFVVAALPSWASGAAVPGHPDKATVAAEQPAADAASYTAAALRLLGEQLAARTAEIDRRQEELDELSRGGEILSRAGLAPDTQPPVAQPTELAPVEATNAVAASPVKTNSAFQSLQRAYENMEPESAARALTELAARDKEAVIQLLGGWKPRTTGAILDALTQANPGLAADLSYEIWKRDGKTGG